MTKMKNQAVFVLAIVAILVDVSFAALPPYEITDLGRCTAFGINNAGQVVGGFWSASRSERAFLWDRTTGMTDLGTLGGVWAWGYNYYGQLGNGNSGSEADESTPVQVKKDIGSPLTNIFYVDAGYLYSAAIDENGKFWVWGRNNRGQLGLDDQEDRNYATQMP